MRDGAAGTKEPTLGTGAESTRGAESSLIGVIGALGKRALQVELTSIGAAVI
jgi:hypothetical protein